MKIINKKNRKVNLTEKDYMILENYLDGQLDEVAKNALQRRMQDDSDFRREAKDFLLTLAALKNKRNTILSNKLTSIEKQNPYEVKKGAKPISIKAWIGLAIAACFCSFIIYEKVKTADNQDVMLYFEPLAWETDRGINDNKRIQAIEAYINKNYAQAAIYFDEAFDENKRDTTLLLYAGVAYLANQQADKSLERLTPISLSQREKESDDARWYAALAHLSLKNTAEAQKILNLLIVSKSNYSENAKKLQTEMTK
jgi:hypothetical protein